MADAATRIAAAILVSGGCSFPVSCQVLVSHTYELECEYGTKLKLHCIALYININSSSEVNVITKRVTGPTVLNIESE